MHAEPVEHRSQVVSGVEQSTRVEHRRRDDQHRCIDKARKPHGEHHVDELEAEDAAARIVRLPHDAVLRQCGMQVDHVRHNGRAEDSDSEQHALFTGEPGDEAAHDP